MPIKIQQGEVFAAHQDCVYALCQGPEDHQFISAGADGHIIIW